MIKINPELQEESLLKAVEEICIAIRTAPKAKGIDNLITAIITDEDKEKLARKMEEISQVHNHQGFNRNAKNVRQAQAILLVGTKVEPIDLKLCGLCGYNNCAENRDRNGLCIFNIHDLGIAVGSAVSSAAHLHIDNRIMYTIGWAAKEMKLLGEEYQIIMGIPLSVSGKNPFFDRK